MDIDLDFPPSFNPSDVFPQFTRASMVQKDELKKHPCGVYFQNIPRDPITHFAAIPFKEAEQLGYFKIDFLHLNDVLDYFNSKEEIRALLKHDPDWSLCVNDDVIPKLFHLGKWGLVLKTVKPTSILELADCLALIRPNKQHLLHSYSPTPTLRAELYKTADKSDFKKAHAIAYAHVIVLQLHLIKAGIL